MPDIKKESDSRIRLPACQLRFVRCYSQVRAVWEDVLQPTDAASGIWNCALGCVSETPFSPPESHLALPARLWRCLYLLSGNC